MTGPASPELLHGRRVTLRRPTVGDAPVLAGILAEPEVGRWWPPLDVAGVRRDLIEPREDEEPWVIEHEGRVVGYIQSWEEAEPDFRHAGIDLFLTTSAQGKGLGPDAITTLAADLIDRRGHHRLTIDPVAANVRAIAAYRKVGFRPVGIMRAYQRTGQGWEDGLLMDLLADELVRPS